jgi:hypothetical protein
MMKTILSTVAVATLITFSGCSAITDNPVANAAKGAAGAVVDGTKGAVSGAANLAGGKPSLKDMATDKAVEAADGKTNGAASKVIDAVK